MDRAADEHAVDTDAAPPTNDPERARDDAERARDDDFDDDAPSDAPRGRRVWVHAALFVATFLSVLYTGAMYAGGEEPTGLAATLRALPRGLSYAAPLMAILVVHEFSHYFAARIHRVEASLPYFIPLPFVSLIGTMGAVISMRGRIKSRDAVLDIGASGPIGGLLVALPVLAYGLAHSPVKALTLHGGQEGQSLLYLLMKRVVLGPIPDGSDVYLNPIAWAGWVGLLVTALNLIPVGQLDGGHVAYALFGDKQDTYARWIHRGILVAFAYNVVRFVGGYLLHGGEGELSTAISNSLFWLVWWGLIAGMKRMSGGVNHPRFEPGALHPARRVVAWITLALFVLLFMPTPFASY
jgi:Zn-dependent protease